MNLQAVIAGFTGGDEPLRKAAPVAGLIVTPGPS